MSIKIHWAYILFKLSKLRFDGCKFYNVLSIGLLRLSTKVKEVSGRSIYLMNEHSYLALNVVRLDHSPGRLVDQYL